MALRQRALNAVLTVPRSVSTMLALNRTVGIVLVSVLFFGLGEQLWSPFLPAYFEAKMGANGTHAPVDRPCR